MHLLFRTSSLSLGVEKDLLSFGVNGLEEEDRDFISVNREGFEGPRVFRGPLEKFTSKTESSTYVPDSDVRIGHDQDPGVKLIVPRLQ